MTIPDAQPHHIPWPSPGTRRWQRLPYWFFGIQVASTLLLLPCVPTAWAWQLLLNLSALLPLELVPAFFLARGFARRSSSPAWQVPAAHCTASLKRLLWWLLLGLFLCGQSVALALLAFSLVVMQFAEWCSSRRHPGSVPYVEWQPPTP